MPPHHTNVIKLCDNSYIVHVFIFDLNGEIIILIKIDK